MSILGTHLFPGTEGANRRTFQGDVRDTVTGDILHSSWVPRGFRQEKKGEWAQTILVLCHHETAEVLRHPETDPLIVSQFWGFGTGRKVAQEQKRWEEDSPVWGSLWRPTLVPTTIPA